MRPVEEPTVTTDGYAKSMAAHLPRIPPPIRRRLEYTALIELHLDIPSMQCDQRGAMPMETMVAFGRTSLGMR
jgi:hypothetical protein